MILQRSEVYACLGHHGKNLAGPGFIAEFVYDADRASQLARHPAHKSGAYSLVQALFQETRIPIITCFGVLHHCFNKDIQEVYTVPTSRMRAVRSFQSDKYASSASLSPQTFA